MVLTVCHVGLLDAAVVGNVLALRVGAVDAGLYPVHSVPAILICRKTEVIRGV